jgi:CRISPR/Cas system CMR-associated protein Cmr5 small subunit
MGRRANKNTNKKEKVDESTYLYFLKKYWKETQTEDLFLLEIKTMLQKYTSNKELMEVISTTYKASLKIFGIEHTYQLLKEVNHNLNFKKIQDF